MGELVVVNKDVTSSGEVSTDFVVYSSNVSGEMITTDFSVLPQTDTFQLQEQTVVVPLDVNTGIEDADHDSELYVRSNGAWVVLDKTVFPDTPDSYLYTQVTALNSFKNLAAGLTTDNEGRFVSIDDLLQMGIITRTGTGFDYLVPNEDIIYSGPKVVAVPPKPENFKVVGGFGHIQLFWEPAKLEYSNHYITQIYRSTSMLLASANIIASVPLSYHYVDATASLNTTYYYWIRFVNTEAEHGPFTDAVAYAVAKLPTAVVKDSLAGEVDSSLLAEELLTPITSITAPGGIQDTLLELDAELIASTQAAADAVEQEALTRANALLAEAEARGTAIDTVTNLIESTEQSLVSRIDLITSTFGEGLDVTEVWNFNTDTEGWTSEVGTATQAAGKLIPAFSSTTSAISTAFIADGGEYGSIRVRISKVGNPTWTGKLYYKTTFATTFSEARVETIPEPTFFGGLAVLNFEMAENNDWAISIITQLKLVAALVTDASNYYAIDWVKIGRASDGDSIAALVNEVNLLTAAGEATAEVVTTLAAQVRGTYEGSDLAYVNAGLLHDAVQFTLEGDKALGKKSEILEVGLREISESDGDLDGALSGWKQLAKQTEFSQVQSDLNSVTASTLTSLQASIDDSVALIETVQNTLVDADTVLAQSITTLSAVVDDVEASVVTEQLARITADASEALLRSTLRADFEAQKGITTAQISGAVAAESSVTATALGVVSSNISYVNGRVDNTNADVQDLSEVVTDVQGGVAATRTIKLQVNSEGKLYAAGMGVSLSNTGGTLQSEVLFVADSFRVMHTANGVVTSQPFKVTGGSVYIDSAFIESASIS